jgi:hypothetical protein
MGVVNHSPTQASFPQAAPEAKFAERDLGDRPRTLLHLQLAAPRRRYRLRTML